MQCAAGGGAVGQQVLGLTVVGQILPGDDGDHRGDFGDLQAKIHIEDEVLLPLLCGNQLAGCICDAHGKILIVKCHCPHGDAGGKLPGSHLVFAAGFRVPEVPGCRQAPAIGNESGELRQLVGKLGYVQGGNRILRLCSQVGRGGSGYHIPINKGNRAHHIHPASVRSLEAEVVCLGQVPELDGKKISIHINIGI